MVDHANQITTVTFHRPQYRPNYGSCDEGFLDWMREWANDPVQNSNGVKVNFISDQDLEDPNEIANAKLIIIPGHSEYWTRKARYNFDQFVEMGKNALILSGNAFWCQVRYENNNWTHDDNKLTCYRGANWVAADLGPIPFNNLLGTYPFMSPDLKYSVLGNIGCDWLRGGQTYNSTENSGLLEFGGQKIISTGSHFFDNVSLPHHPSNSFPYIPIPSGSTEYDGTLVKCNMFGKPLNASGNPIQPTEDPVIDVSALGFYQAEIIGYEKGQSVDQFEDPDNDALTHYLPFLVFKKTKNSGTVVNVSSNLWCSDEDLSWTGSNPYRKDITKNMVIFMLDDITHNKHGEELFTNVPSGNPGPGNISLTHAYTNVSYSVCSGGSVHIDPYGIYLDQAYKVDHGFTSSKHHNIHPRHINDLNNMMSISFDPTCTQWQPYRQTQTHSDENENTFQNNSEPGVTIFPNPAQGTFTIDIQSDNNTLKEIIIYDAVGQEIYRKEKFNGRGVVVDLTAHKKGVYWVKTTVNEKTMMKRIVIV